MDNSNSLEVLPDNSSHPDIRTIQDNNLKLLEKMRVDLRMNYGERRFIPGGRYLIDLFNPEDLETVYNETKEIFKRKDIGSYFESQNIVVNIVRPTEYLVFNKRVNIAQYPVADEEYIAQPYLFKHPTQGDSLNQVSAEYVYSPAVILGDCIVGKQKWLYIRTNTVAGWIKDFSSNFTRGLSAEEIEYDPIRVSDTETKMQRQGNSLGIITTFGLKEDNGELIPINSVETNSQFELKSKEEFESLDEYMEYIMKLSPEIFGDGIIEEGESSLVSMGNVVIITGSDGENFIIRLPDGKSLKVRKEYVNKGFMELTQDNAKTLMQSVNGRAYSWGDGNGAGYDCSGLVKSYLNAFGVLVGRGGDSQRYGLEGNEIILSQRLSNEEDFNNFLPRNIQELKDKGINPNDIKWGFATISWGTHVMIMANYDNKTGDIMYIHSVAKMKDSQSKAPKNARLLPEISSRFQFRKKNEDEVKIAPPKQLWRVVYGPIDNIGYRYAKTTEEMDPTVHTFAPFLAFKEDSFAVDRSRVVLVNHI